MSDECKTEKPQKIYFNNSSLLINGILRYRYVCKWDMDELNTDENKSEELARYLFKWRSYMQAAIKAVEIINAFDDICD